MESMAHFELFDDKVLGEGSFGEVCQCNWHGSIAAAKLLHVAEADETAEILKEIELIKKLHNEHIIQFFGTAHCYGKLCLITSYAEKSSLYRALFRHTLTHGQKQSIITGLIKGMQYLKSNQVVHRNLKSSNVLLDSNYVPKICDFGLAKLKEVTTTLTISGAPVNNVRWMAPELFEINPRYSFESDVYALGVVIWEMMTEQLPYANVTDINTIVALIQDGKHQDMPDGIPAHYKFIIKNCWHRKPGERFSVEQISQVNEDNLSKMDTELNSNGPDNELNTKDSQPKLSPVDYLKILNRYLQDSSHILDSKDLLASILKEHGEGFQQWVEAASKQDNSAVAIILGEMHYHGCGVPQSYQAAAGTFSMVVSDSGITGLSTKQEKLRAQFNLGWMSMNGHGIPYDDVKAAEWYTNAAMQDHAAAQFFLGLMYENGRGVPQSNDKAVEWVTKAAEQGNVQAQYNLGWMYLNGKCVSQNGDKAVQWFTTAAAQGYTHAQYNLGWMYMSGEGVPRNDDRAVEWFTRAAEQGHADAQYNLGWMKRNGRRVL